MLSTGKVKVTELEKLAGILAKTSKYIAVHIKMTSYSYDVSNSYFSMVLHCGIYRITLYSWLPVNIYRNAMGCIISNILIRIIISKHDIHETCMLHV